MPVLQDLYEALLRQDEKEAHQVATALEIYVTGALNLFNHRTNVDINNRLVCYDIKELGKQLKKIGMLVVHTFKLSFAIPIGICARSLISSFIASKVTLSGNEGIGGAVF